MIAVKPQKYSASRQKEPVKPELCYRYPNCNISSKPDGYIALAKVIELNCSRTIPRRLMMRFTNASIAVMLISAASAAQAAPSFCARPEGRAEEIICADKTLQAADQKLNTALTSAKAKANAKDSKRLAAEQRGWWLGVRDCWKATDAPACIAQQYELRTIELQTAWKLVPSRGPVRFQCADGADLDVSYFDTQPPSLIAVRKDEQSLMRAAVTASGTHYVGRNESIREHQGEARVTWGYEAPEVICKPR